MDVRDEKKDYYKVLEVDFDATEESIRLNYRRLALKWHPDKHKDEGDDDVTAKFQEINEAYEVLSDPVKRLGYDMLGNFQIDKYSLGEYLARFKGMILTCNGLGINHTSLCLASAGSSLKEIATDCTVITDDIARSGPYGRRKFITVVEEWPVQINN